MTTLHQGTVYNAAADLLKGEIILVEKNILLWVDSTSYNGTINFEFSPDKINWFSVIGEDFQEGGLGVDSVLSPADGIYFARPPIGSWFRVRMSGGSAGSLIVRARNADIPHQSSEAVTVTTAPTASEVHLGQIDGYCYVPAADLAFTADTSALADGDVITNTLDLGDVFRVNDGTGILQSIKITDKDDQGVAMDLYFLDSNTSLGTLNSAPNISDANVSDAILGHVSIEASDWKDLGGAKMATLKNVGLGVRAATGTKKLYVSAVSRGGAPTYTASGLLIRVTVL